MGACEVCAPRIEGKRFALLTTSGAGARHACGSTIVTSRVISWHISREAAEAARRTHRRTHGYARCYVNKSAQ